MEFEYLRIINYFTQSPPRAVSWRLPFLLLSLVSVVIGIALFSGLPALSAGPVEGSRLTSSMDPIADSTFIGAYPFSGTSDLQSAEVDFARSPLKLVKTYRAWFRYGDPSSYLGFDPHYKQNFDLIVDGGAVVYLAWDAWDSVTTDIPILDQINSGSHDDYIRSVADSINTYSPNPVVIDLFHEANGDWYPWSPERGTRAKSANRKYRNFRDAYRRVQEIFVEQKVTNVTWVLSFNTDTVNASSDFSRYYPGDSHVDWLGLDGYNWGTSRSWSSWRSFDQVMAGNSDSYSQVSSFGKPVVLAEFASVEEGGDKAEWIKDAFTSIATDYDFVGFIWFNIEKEVDWRVNSSDAAKLAFQESVNYECYLDGQDQGGSSPGCPSSPGSPGDPPSKSLHLAKLQGILHQVGPQNQGQAEVWIEDGSGNPQPVEGVLVSGNWTELRSKATSSSSDAGGYVKSWSGRTKANGCFVFTITGLEKSGYTYDPDSNDSQQVTMCTGN